MLDKNQFVGIFGNNAVKEVKIVNCFSESINRLATSIDSIQID